MHWPIDGLAVSPDSTALSRAVSDRGGLVEATVGLSGSVLFVTSAESAAASALVCRLTSSALKTFKQTFSLEHHDGRPCAKLANGFNGLKVVRTESGSYEVRARRDAAWLELTDAATGARVATWKRWEIALVDGPIVHFDNAARHPGPFVGTTEDGRTVMTLWWERHRKRVFTLDDGVTRIAIGDVDLGTKTIPAVALACHQFAPRPIALAENAQLGLAAERERSGRKFAVNPLSVYRRVWK
jgi:hypothetical protein